ncbi:hypothetical protein M6G08_19230 [Streptomyces sp. M92]|nr:hypothetical protein [Streptomyces sp. M92]WCN07327.1 hypothetical protein M6G08_19230 [Streptomyces sp. M92]
MVHGVGETLAQVGDEGGGGPHQVTATAVVIASFVQWRTRQRRISGPEPPGRRPAAPLLTLAVLVLAGFVVAVTALAP